MLRLASLSSCTLLIAYLVASQALGFDMSYRYALIEGKNVELCRHMLGVYTKAFEKPWSVATAPRGEDKSEVFAETLFARYPTSPEFDAVKWEAHQYKDGLIQHSALYAQFDVDNDGTDDLVVRVGFFRGSPGSWDYLWVFPIGAVDFSAFRTGADFRERIAPRRKAVLGYPIHQRPFRYKGRTYIHGYTFTPRTAPGADPAEPFGPPEYLLISQYLGGPANDAEVQARSRSITLVCKYSMIQRR